VATAVGARKKAAILMPRMGRTPPRQAADSRAPRREARRSRRDTYWTLATRPLHIFVFLAPFIAAYEIGAATVLGPHAAGIETIRAHERLARALDVLGVAGAFLPWVVLVTILLVAHFMARDPWRIRPGVVLGMLFESAALTLPLLVLAAVLFRFDPGAAPPAMAQTVPLSDLPWTARGVLSIGAGLYEELVFRMILLAAVHMVLADFARVRSDISAAVAITVSAIAFALYHDLSADGAALAQSAFYVLAGVYFGAVYAVRGFGVVVGAHAIYDFMVLVVL
jgi:membrane protease YdiL (CAAX protease family)